MNASVTFMDLYAVIANARDLEPKRGDVRELDGARYVGERSGVEWWAYADEDFAIICEAFDEAWGELSAREDADHAAHERKPLMLDEATVLELERESTCHHCGGDPDLCDYCALEGECNEGDDDEHGECGPLECETCGFAGSDCDACVRFSPETLAAAWNPCEGNHPDDMRHCADIDFAPSPWASPCDQCWARELIRKSATELAACVAELDGTDQGRREHEELMQRRNDHGLCAECGTQLRKQRETKIPHQPAFHVCEPCWDRVTTIPPIALEPGLEGGRGLDLEAFGPTRKRYTAPHVVETIPTWGALPGVALAVLEAAEAVHAVGTALAAEVGGSALGRETSSVVMTTSGHDSKHGRDAGKEGLYPPSGEDRGSRVGRPTGAVPISPGVTSSLRFRLVALTELELDTWLDLEAVFRARESVHAPGWMNRDTCRGVIRRLERVRARRAVVIQALMPELTGPF